jgi:hypothetical protein
MTESDLSDLSENGYLEEYARIKLKWFFKETDWIKLTEEHLDYTKEQHFVAGEIPRARCSNGRPLEEEEEEEEAYRNGRKLHLDMKYSYLSELTVTELWQLELVEEKLLASGTSRRLMEQTLFISRIKR